jgi:predicted DNA-binding transcriptional regulator YafY
MSLFKHPTVRYRAIDSCLRNPGRSYTIDDLVEACNIAMEKYNGESGVQKRSIYKDLNYMEEVLDAPIIKIRDGHKIIFRYEDMSFSINNQPINEMEANQLKEALYTLSRFKGMPQFEWVEELAVKLDSGLGLSTADSAVIEFQQNEFLKGLEHITPLYNAIINKTNALTLTYQTFNQKKPETFIFHPHYLKQYNNRWFVFGKKDSTNFQSSHYALDRIVDIKNAKKKYEPNKEINYKEHFDEIVGVTFIRNNPTESVVLRVKNERLPYILTKPIHGSQSSKIEEGKTHSIITLKKIRQNQELKSLLLSYGEDIEVIEPKSLRAEIKEKVNAMYKIYK